MPGFPVPDSGGAPVQDNAGPRSGFLPSGKPGGQITISRREALALIAFDSEDDEKTAIQRARRETSFDDDQLARLKNRAEKVRAKGYTLTNGAHKFMPTNFDGDTDSLLGQEEQRGDAKNRGARDGRRASSAAKKPIAKTQQGPGPAGATRKTQEAWARVHECDGDAKCGPCNAAYLAAAPAREAFAKRVREKKRKASCMQESRRPFVDDPRFERALREAQGPVAFTAMVEKWSPEARAAAAAGRKAKGSGKDWRSAARKAYMGDRGSAAMAHNAKIDAQARPKSNDRAPAPWYKPAGKYKAKSNDDASPATNKFGKKTRSHLASTLGPRFAYRAAR